MRNNTLRQWLTPRTNRTTGPHSSSNLTLRPKQHLCTDDSSFTKMGRKKRRIKLSEMADNILNASAPSNYAKLFFLNSHCRRRPIDVFDERLLTRTVESQISLEAKRLSCKYCDRVFHKRYVLLLSLDYSLLHVLHKCKPPSGSSAVCHSSRLTICHNSEIEILCRGFRFGLSRHVKAVHHEVLRELAEGIKTTSDRRYRKDVRSLVYLTHIGFVNLLSVLSFQVREDVAEDREADDEDALDLEDEFNEMVDMERAAKKCPPLPTFDMQDWLVQFKIIRIS